MKRLFLVLFIPFLLASCSNGSVESSESQENSSINSSSTSSENGDTFTVEIDNISYALEKSGANNLWVSSYILVKANDEVTFKYNGQAISIYSEGMTSTNNITETHPNASPFTSVHVKNGGFVTIALKNTEGVYTFWIGEPKYYDSDVKHCEYPVYVVGGSSDWQKSVSNIMTASSIREVAKFDMNLADKLQAKQLDYVYIGDYTFTSNVGVENKYLDSNNQLQHRDMGYFFKIVLYEASYNADYWIPSSSYHIEALDDITFVGPFVDYDSDINGFNYESDLMCLSDAGHYKVVFTKYHTSSTLTTPGYGIALIKQ